jgi:hypothetical protein
LCGADSSKHLLYNAISLIITRTHEVYTILPILQIIEEKHQRMKQFV